MKFLHRKNKKQLPSSTEELQTLARNLQKRNKRLKWRSYLFLATIIAAAWFIAFHFTEAWWLKQIVVQVTPVNPVRSVKAAEITLPETVQEKIRAKFETNAYTFLQIAMAESGQNAGGKGFNCHYYNSEGRRYSDACEPEDRGNAWSVDCGTLQVNVLGKICPPEMYDIDYNLEAAKGKFDRQGWNAWTVCKRKTVICK